MTLLDTQLTKKKHTLIGDIATDELECVLEEELLFFFLVKEAELLPGFPLSKLLVLASMIEVG